MLWAACLTQAMPAFRPLTMPCPMAVPMAIAAPKKVAALGVEPLQQLPDLAHDRADGRDDVGLDGRPRPP